MVCIAWAFEQEIHFWWQTETFFLLLRWESHWQWGRSSAISHYAYDIFWMTLSHVHTIFVLYIFRTMLPYAPGYCFLIKFLLALFAHFLTHWHASFKLITFIFRLRKYSQRLFVEQLKHGSFVNMYFDFCCPVFSQAPVLLLPFSVSKFKCMPTAIPPWLLYFLSSRRPTHKPIRFHVDFLWWHHVSNTVRFQ